MNSDAFLNPRLPGLLSFPELFLLSPLQNVIVFFDVVSLSLSHSHADTPLLKSCFPPSNLPDIMGRCGTCLCFMDFEATMRQKFRTQAVKLVVAKENL